MNRLLFPVVAASLLASAFQSHAQVVSTNLLIKEGDALGGSTVSLLNSPFINGNGQVGFLAGLDDDNRSIWFDGAQLFNTSDALPDVLTGGEGTMGISNSGNFIYSPSFNGEDAVYNQDGLILQENTQAPGFASGISSTFHSRPQMSDDGTSYWVAGFNDGAGGTASVGRMLYRQNTDTTIDIVLRAGDMIGSDTVAEFGAIAFDYSFSDDNVHSVIEFNSDTGSTADDGRLMVDFSVVASEGQATGQGDNWDNFDHSGINNAGNYLFSGDTDGDSSTDEFIAYNGTIQLRQGDALAGGTLAGFVDGVTINESNNASFLFELDEGSGANETLFYATDAAALGDAFVIASVGDQLDIDNDGTADWILDDFNAGLGPGIALAENGLVYVEVDLASLDGSSNIEAVVGFSVVAIPEPSSTVIVTLMLGGILATRRDK